MAEKLRFNRSRMEWQPPKAKTPFEKIDDSIERARSDGFWAGIVLGVAGIGPLWILLAVAAAVIRGNP